MSIFYGKGSWSSKVNFVDDNNILVGFDNEDNCCARGGWFISDKPDKWLHETFKEEVLDMPGWNFDPDYFKEIEVPKDAYEGGAAQFRLVNGKKEKFLTLYNFHNGYYGRGFNMTIGGKEMRDGSV